MSNHGRVGSTFWWVVMMYRWLLSDNWIRLFSKIKRPPDLGRSWLRYFLELAMLLVTRHDNISNSADERYLSGYTSMEDNYGFEISSLNIMEVVLMPSSERVPAKPCSMRPQEGKFQISLILNSVWLALGKSFSFPSMFSRLSVKQTLKHSEVVVSSKSSETKDSHYIGVGNGQQHEMPQEVLPYNSYCPRLL